MERLGDHFSLASCNASRTLNIIWYKCRRYRYILYETYVYRPICCVMRNFNSPNHGSNIQHLKHQAKTSLIKSVVTGEPTKLLRRRSNCTRGNTKSKCSRHILTTCISVVLNNFMKKRLTTKSREARCDLFRGSASSPYNKIGTHLVLIRWITTSSEAMRPTLPKILLAAR